MPGETNSWGKMVLELFGKGAVSSVAGFGVNKLATFALAQLGWLQDNAPEERHAEVMERLGRIESKVDHLIDHLEIIDRELAQMARDLKLELRAVRSEIVINGLRGRMDSVRGLFTDEFPNGLMGLIRQTKEMPSSIDGAVLDQFARKVIEKERDWRSILEAGMPGTLHAQGLITVWGDGYLGRMDPEGYDRHLDAYCQIFQDDVRELIDHQLLGVLLLINAHEQLGHGARVQEKLAQDFIKVVREELILFVDYIERMVLSQYKMTTPRALQEAPAGTEEIFRRVDAWVATTCGYLTDQDVGGIYGRLMVFPSEIKKIAEKSRPVKHPLFDNDRLPRSPVKGWRFLEFSYGGGAQTHLDLAPASSKDYEIFRFFQPAETGKVPLWIDGKKTVQVEDLELEAEIPFAGVFLDRTVDQLFFKEVSNKGPHMEPWNAANVVPKMSMERAIPGSNTVTMVRHAIPSPKYVLPKVHARWNAVPAPIRLEVTWKDDGPASHLPYESWTTHHIAYGNAFTYKGPKRALHCIILGKVKARAGSTMTLKGRKKHHDGLITPYVNISFQHAASGPALGKLFSWEGKGTAITSTRAKEERIKISVPFYISEPLGSQTPLPPIMEASKLPWQKGTTVNGLVVHMGFRLEAEKMKGYLKLNAAIELDLETIRFAWG